MTVQSDKGALPVESLPVEHAPIPWRSYAMLAVVMLFWSGNMIVGRSVRDDIPPFTLAFIRWTGAALMALPFAWRHVVADREVLQTGWPRILLLGLTGVAAFNALVYSGLHYTTATNALLLQAAIPAIVLMCNGLFFRMAPPVAQVVGVVLSTIGVLYILLRGAPLAIFDIGFNRGDMLVLCGVFCWSIYTSLLRIRPDCHPLTFLILTFAIAIVVMAPLAATEAAQIAKMTVSWKVVGACAYVALLPSLVAYLMYNAAVRDIGAGRAGQTISLMPLFGSLLAVALLGEVLHGYHIAGMLLILGGIVVAALAGRR
ncbi:MAG: DMT family transporter [Sphingobium sp.]